MALWKNVKNSFRSLLGREDDLFLTSQEGESPSERDTLAAIRALNQEVRNDPDGVETYLALGNLYRARGDIERAIQIRNGLIVRPALDNNLKARTFFELGLDYKRGGFIDRSFKAFDEALAYGGPEDAITLERAMLYADIGNFRQAAKTFGSLGHYVAEAYYLTRISEECLRAGELDEAVSLAKKAVRAYGASVEGWLQRIKLAALQSHFKDVRKFLRLALQNIKPEVQFLLYEGLLACLNMPPETSSKPSPQAEENADAWRQDFCEAIIAEMPASNGTLADMLLDYYKGLFLLRYGKSYEAGTCFEKAVISAPSFWAPRLELLALSFAHQNTSPMFNEQINYFIQAGTGIKRFVCKRCGLKLESIFFICPKCRSWHSAMFRRSLKD